MQGQLLGGLVALVLVAGCTSSGGAANESFKCLPASLDVLAQIGDGLTTPHGRGLFEGQVVTLVGRVGDYRRVVAAKINVGVQPVGVWAMGRTSIDSVNEVALRYTQWGRAARPGSQITHERAELRASGEYQAVLRCAGQAE